MVLETAKRSQQTSWAPVEHPLFVAPAGLLLRPAVLMMVDQLSAASVHRTGRANAVSCRVLTMSGPETGDEMAHTPGCAALF